MPDPLIIAGREFGSRLFLGTDRERRGTDRRREVVRAGASLPEITLGGSNRAAMIILPRKWQLRILFRVAIGLAAKPQNE